MSKYLTNHGWTVNGWIVHFWIVHGWAFHAWNILGWKITYGFWVEMFRVEMSNCPPITPFLHARKSQAQNGQNDVTPWGLTLIETYLIFVDNLDLWLTMSSSKSAFSDKSATWSLNSWKSIVKSPSLCPLLTRTFGAFGERYFIKGYCQLSGCGLICGTSPLERPKKQFQ